MGCVPLCVAINFWISIQLIRMDTFILFFTVESQVLNQTMAQNCCHGSGLGQAWTETILFM